MILNYNCLRMQLIRINKKFNKSNPPKKLKKKRKTRKKDIPKDLTLKHLDLCLILKDGCPNTKERDIEKRRILSQERLKDFLQVNSR